MCLSEGAKKRRVAFFLGNNSQVSAAVKAAPRPKPAAKQAARPRPDPRNYMLAVQQEENCAFGQDAPERRGLPS